MMAAPPSSPRPPGLLSRSARLALGILLAFACFAVAAPALESILGVEHDVPQLAARHCKSSWPHLLGCDDIGQDLFLRLLFGARISLLVGVGAAALSTMLGVLIGTAAGYVGGRVDAVLMRVVDAMLSIPVLPLLLLASATAISTGASSGLGSIGQLILLLALFGWMGVARLVRAETLRLRNLDFVVAAHALGAGAGHVIWRHLVPNLLPSILVAATIDVGKNILAEAALSYLGLGVQPPTPSWGNMLRHAEDAIYINPLLAFWPGACILVVVTSVFALGEALRVRLDPQSCR